MGNLGGVRLSADQMFDNLGLTLTDFGSISANFGSISIDVGRSRPKLATVLRTWSDFGRTCPKSGQMWPRLDQFEGEFHRIWPNPPRAETGRSRAAESGSNLAEICRSRPKSSQIRASSAQIWPTSLRRSWAKIGRQRHATRILETRLAHRPITAISVIVWCFHREGSTVMGVAGSDMLHLAPRSPIRKAHAVYAILAVPKGQRRDEFVARTGRVLERSLLPGPPRTGAAACRMGSGRRNLPEMGDL